MAEVSRPRFASHAVCQAGYALIKGEKLNVTTNLDLSQKMRGRIFIGLGFGGSTDLTNGVDVRINAFDSSGVTPAHPGTVAAYRSDIDPGLCLVNNGAGYSAGATSIAYDGATGRAFVAGDFLCFWDVTTIPTASGSIGGSNGTEFLRMGKGATTPFLLERGLKYGHADNSYIGLANCWTIDVGPGEYEVIFDYLDDAAGEAVACYVSCDSWDIEKVTV